MKKLTRMFLTLAVAGALLCGGAMAAEEDAIKVQLDGQELTFTDAYPQMKDDRTFLPVRVVFEAMGAQVSYNEETLTVTAIRGEKTIYMTMGSTELTVIEGETSSTIQMDVAPYIDEETWRTYIPVRFAAEALDCLVGWVDESNTAVIVNTQKLLADALEGKSFTYMEKLAEFAGKYDQGIWDMRADVDMVLNQVKLDMSDMSKGVQVVEEPLFTVTGTATGTIQDGAKESMDMNMKMDMAALIAKLARGELTEEDAAMLESLATEGVDVSMRMDLTAGVFYMNMAAKVMEQAGLDPDTWYKMDLAEVMGQTGMDAMALSQGLDLSELLNTVLSSGGTVNSVTAYSEIKAVVEGLCAIFADENFQLDEDGWYTIEYSMEDGDTTLACYLSLEMTDDTVTGYEMGVSIQAEAVTVALNMGMTDEGQMAMEARLIVGGMLTGTMTMEGAYTQGTAAPETEPPAGATIRDMNSLDDLAGVMSLPEEV